MTTIDARRRHRGDIPFDAKRRMTGKERRRRKERARLVSEERQRIRERWMREGRG